MTVPAPVSILGFAACSSVGYSLESTLAAMGAGLSNFTETSVGDEFGQLPGRFHRLAVEFNDHVAAAQIRPSRWAIRAQIIDHRAGHPIIGTG